MENTEKNEELRDILEKVAEKIIKKTIDKPKKVYRTKIVDVDSPHGIYKYERSTREWILIDTDSDGFKPYKDGYYVIYFDNAKCPACRIYDLFWYPFIETIGRNLSNVEFIIVLCEWFARQCRSRAASNTFKKFEVIASPTTALIEVKNNNIVREEKIRGVVKIDELAKKVLEFIGIEMK